MRTGRLIAIAGLLVGLSSHAASAAILDTITNGNIFLVGAVWALDGGSGGQSLGIQFQLTSATTIGEVEAYIRPNSTLCPTCSFTGTLGIMGNAGSGATGTPSGSFMTGDTFAFTASTVPVDQTGLNWSLGPGFYWLVGVASSTSNLLWQNNGAASALVYSWAFSEDPTGASGWLNGPAVSPLRPMAIINAATVSTVPLPAALPLFATGLGALGLLGWRRKKKAIDA